MINQIQLLRNVGQFDSVTPQLPAALTQLVLVYAENGRGKTTLANIIRSLGTNNPLPISERRRLGAQHAPHVVLTATNQAYVFQNDRWSAQFPEIAVFDDHFVAENVCSGIQIQTEQRQNLHELILGAQGVALNKALQGHVAKIEEHNRALREKEAAIPPRLRGNLSVDAFCELTEKPNIDGAIEQAERNLTAARSAESISKQARFQPFELPSFNLQELENLLARDLSGLQADASASVRAQIAKLGRNSEAWIADGLARIGPAPNGLQQMECPFCKQSLQTSDIVIYYEAYFSEGYGLLKAEITNYGKSIAAAHGPEVQTAFERSISTALQGVSFWKQFVEMPTMEIDTAEAARVWKASREPVLEILRSKLASPLEKMTLPENVRQSLVAYQDYRESIRAKSDALQGLNDQINLVKERSAVANIPTLTADLAKLKITQARHSAATAALCTIYQDEKAAKKATELLRDSARQALDQYRSAIFVQYEAAINVFLQKLNAGFRLSSVSSVNNRGGSSCHYNVLINNVAVPITADSGPSFRTTMSAGDRNTLALAFFFASLEKNPNLGLSVVVIDDPMTSLDEHRTLATIHEIRELVTKVKQVIVLSHSKPFLCQVWDGAERLGRTAIKISRRGQSSSIDVWDVSQDYVTEHDKRYALIKDYIDNGNPGKEREVATALRYVLEAFLRVAYPDFYPPGTLLGAFHQRCTQSLGTPPIILSQSDTTELRRLMDYANKFHHDTNPAYATAIVNDAELLDHSKRTLKFAQRT